jgi:hypothetical protein
VKPRGTFCPVGRYVGGSPLEPTILKEIAMKGIIAWAVGLPIPIIILLYVFDVF